MASMVYPVAPAPGLGLELRKDPLGNTFLNWPAVEDEPHAFRPRSRSCPGHISIHRAASTEPKARQAAGPENATQGSEAPGPGPALGRAGASNERVRPQKLELIQVRPQKLELIQEQLVMLMHQLGEAVDGAGCTSASTWCSGGWGSYEGDNGGEQGIDDSFTGLDATVGSHASKPDVVANAELAEPEGPRLYLDSKEQHISVWHMEQNHVRRQRARNRSQETPAAFESLSAAELAGTARGGAGPGGRRPEAGGGFTTLMIRRLPTSISQAELAVALNSDGFKDAYDLLYMPSVFDTSRVRGAGYAFVNMTEPSSAERLLEAWNRGRPFGKLQAKGLHISVADIQGWEANLAKWNTPKMTRIRDPNHRPIIRGKN